MASLTLFVGGHGYVFNFTIGDTPKSERPMFVAVFSAITGLAGFVGPLIGGYFFELIETAPAWIERTALMCLMTGRL